MGCSPAQIKLEPVQIVRTTAFEEQKIIAEADENSATKDEEERVISPYKPKSKQKSKSPVKD